MFRFTLLAIALLALGTDARLNKNANKKNGRDLSYYQNHQKNSWSYGYQDNWQNANQAQYQGYTGGGDEAMENQQQQYYENQQQQYEDQQDAYQQQQEQAQEQYEEYQRQYGDQDGSQDQDRNGQMYNGEGQYYQQGNGQDGYYGQNAADRVDSSYTNFDDDLYTEGADTDLHFPNITNIDWHNLHLDMLAIHSQMEFYRLLALIFGAFVLAMSLYICYLQLTISIMKDSRSTVTLVEPVAPASNYTLATEKSAATKEYKTTGLDL